MNSRELFVSWAMVIAYVILNSLGAIAIKSVVHRSGAIDPGSARGLAGFVTSTLFSPAVIAGLAAIGLSACAWIIALSRLPLSIAYPVAVALNCLIVISAGLLLYGEAASWNKFAGIFLLLASLVLLSLDR